MKHEKLRGGVVGCGYIGNLIHIPTLQALKGAEVVAVCDKKEKLALEAAKRFRVPRFYGNFSDMLEKEELDFVDICTDPIAHSSLSIQAMDAGLHVLVEKPMAISLIEADKMVKTSKENNVKLCVDHNFLFNPVVQKAKYLVGTGAIGDLVNVETRILGRMEGIIVKQNHWIHSLPGGMLHEHAPHATYLESAFLHNIYSIHAITGKSGDFPWMPADELKVLLKADNSVGSFVLSYNSPRISLTLDIFGTKKILHLDLFSMNMVQYGPRTSSCSSLVLDNLSSGLQLLVGGAYTSLKALMNQLHYTRSIGVLIRKFIESIQNNSKVPVTGEDGRETVRILETVWKQIKQQ